MSNGRGVRILGIDPGSRFTGFGILEIHNNKYKYITSGCINIGNLDWSLRLRQIYCDIMEVVARYVPTEAAIEQVFVHKNVQSALKLGHARGAALVALANNNLEIAEYSPRDIKKSIVGYGGAEKTQVQRMVKEILGLSNVPQGDSADALGVAICHANKTKGIL